MAEPKYLTGDKAAAKEFIDKFDTFLFDCDGVIWSGDHVFDGVSKTLELLRNQGKKLVFVTNNSTKSRADYVTKFAKLGITVTEDEVFGSSYSAAIYISQILQLPTDKKTVFLVSESGTEAELASVGIRTLGGTDPAFRRDVDPATDLPPLGRGEGLDESVGAVLIALDFHINYWKMAVAMTYVRRGAVLLATNSDPSLPLAGSIFPGAGSVGAGIVKATGKQPIVMGKPSQAMMDAIEGRFKLDRGRTCMVGDRLDTDIKFGNDGGLGGTLLVLSGVTHKQQILGESRDEIVPGYYAETLGDLLGGLE